MTDRLALVEIATEAVLDVFPATRGEILLPGGSRVSPPVPGWRGGGALTYKATRFNRETGDVITGTAPKGVEVVTRDVAETGPVRYLICRVVDARVGKWRRATRDPVFTYDAAKEHVIEDLGVQDMDPSEVEDKLVAEAKSRARKHILALAPDWKQSTLNAQAAVLAEKGRANWTPEEREAWDTGRAVWDRIEAIRAASDAIEAAIRAQPTAGGKEAALEAGTWPA